MTTALTGSKREPLWWPREVKGRIDSARSLRDTLRTGGLQKAKSVDWTEFCRPFQQVANNCTAASQSQLIFVSLGIQGKHPTSMPDQCRPYWYARVMHRDQYVDQGTYTSSGWLAGGRFGYTREDPSRPFRDRIFTPPPAQEDYDAVNVRVESYRIYASGQALLARICDALTRGHPVQLSIPVERSFLDSYGPELIDAPTVPLSLGHAVTVVAFSPSTRGSENPEFTICNSYGPNWRRRGFARLTGEYVMNKSYSVYAVSRVQGWQ